MNRRRFRSLHSGRSVNKAAYKPADQGQTSDVHYCSQPECLMRGKKLWPDDDIISSGTPAMQV